MFYIYEKEIIRRVKIKKTNTCENSMAYVNTSANLILNV